MKVFYTTILCFAFLFSCAQKEINKEDIMNQENITKVTNIYKEVKIYEYNPTYTLHMEKAANFTFEALINDFPVFIEYNPHIVSGSIPINNAILKSGKQKLTIRMTPPVDKNYNMAKEIDMDDIVLRVSINCGEYGKEKVAQFKEPLRYELPKQKNKLPYYEVNLEFNAIAPYQNDIEGWLNGVDLTKEDKNKLFKEIESFYLELIEYYNSKNVEALAKKYYKKQFEIAQSFYQTKIYDSQIVADAWIKNVNDSKPFIFNQYRMKFFGDGKMVALVKTDKYYINFSSLMREDNDGNYTCYRLMLHRPKPGAPLEVIR